MTNTNSPKKRGRMLPPSKITIWMEIADHLDMRANDPWPDELWPAANTVLTGMAAELRRIATGSDGGF